MDTNTPASAKITASNLSLLAVFLIFANTVTAQSHAEEQPLADENIAGSEVFSLEQNRPFKFFTLTFQNDIFVNRDQHYTNGVGFTYGIGPFLEFNDSNTPPLLNHLTKNLYIQNMPNKVHGIAHMFFQRMQTPIDIITAEPQPDDLPWGGLLAIQSTLYAYDKNSSDQFSTFFGVVGPAALAEESQKLVHNVFGSDAPRGWNNQIGNELVFGIEALRVQKLYRRYNKRIGFDVLGLASASLGTIETSGRLGVAVRIGTNLDFTHATFSLQSDRQVNSLSLSESNEFFVYIGARTGWVVRDILINGNTISDSASVPLENLQHLATVGVVWKRNRFAWVFQITESSSRTTLTSRTDLYGALGFTVPFR